jgi:hypothetical protein
VRVRPRPPLVASQARRDGEIKREECAKMVQFGIASSRTDAYTAMEYVVSPKTFKESISHYEYIEENSIMGYATTIRCLM